MRGTRRGTSHRGFKSAFVSSKDGAEAGESTDGRGEKGQEVDLLWDRCEEMDLSIGGGVGYSMGETLVVGEGSGEGGLGWRVGGEEGKGEDGGMGD